jgi:hypothetical protein
MVRRAVGERLAYVDVEVAMATVYVVGSAAMVVATWCSRRRVGLGRPEPCRCS